jgi:hypothetical protein
MTLNYKITAYLRENYRLCLVTKIEGILVRVFKPAGADRLPARDMRWVLSGYARTVNQSDALGTPAHWFPGHPDMGAWDALTLIHAIPGKRTADVYFCAILCRPFSEAAHREYTRLSSFMEAGRRAKHPWDSRVFDRENGHTPKYDISFDPTVPVTADDIEENVTGEDAANGR